ncbi:MAG: hypothetical protein IJV60_00805 [Prevotella sp.]|nr:hypothetical protein [Prevotella sp.]
MQCKWHKTYSTRPETLQKLKKGKADRTDGRTGLKTQVPKRNICLVRSSFAAENNNSSLGAQ